MVYLLVWVFHSGLIQILKLWAARGRPDTGQPLLGGIAGGTSFPSGHSASPVVYFALFGVLLAALTATGAGTAGWRCVSERLRRRSARRSR